MVVATMEVVELRMGVVVEEAPATAPLVIPRCTRTTLTLAPAMRWLSSPM